MKYLHMAFIFIRQPIRNDLKLCSKHVYCQVTYLYITIHAIHQIESYHGFGMLRENSLEQICVISEQFH